MVFIFAQDQPPMRIIELTPARVFADAQEKLRRLVSSKPRRKIEKLASYVIRGSMKYLPILLCAILISCKPSKRELQEEIDCKNDTILLLRRAINNQADYIESLQEKLDNIKSHAEDVQSALDDGSFSDAYDAATDAADEADYDY